MSSHETPPIATKAIIYIIDGKFCTNIRLVDDRVMDTIMKIVLRQLKYSRSILLPPVSFFFGKKKITGILGELRVDFTRAPQRQCWRSQYAQRWDNQLQASYFYITNT